MKVKDLDSSIPLTSVRIKTPLGVVGYWKSQWQQGVWFSDGETSRIYPQFVDDLKDCLEWEITEEEVNCDMLSNYEHINNSKNK
jgi:hypothetical protein